MQPKSNQIHIKNPQIHYNSLQNMGQNKKPTKTTPATSTQPRKEDTKPSTSTSNDSDSSKPEDISAKTKTKQEKTWFKCTKCRYKTTNKDRKTCPIDNSTLQLLKNNKN